MTFFYLINLIFFKTMKQLFYFLSLGVLLSVWGCTQDRVSEQEEYDQLVQNLYPKNEEGVTVLPAADGNARTIFRTAHIEKIGSGWGTYKAAYYRRTGINSWASLHPGANYLTGPVDIPLTWNYKYCRSPLQIRGLRIVPYTVNNPACALVSISVEGEPYYICQTPVPPNGYIDYDEYTLIAGQNMEFKFKTDDGICADEDWIQEGAQCYVTSNPTCN